MRITVTSSIDGVVNDVATQFVDEELAAHIESNRSALVDVEKLLKPFGEIPRKTIESLAARLIVFSVPAMHYTLRGDQTEAENSHVILPSDMPKTIIEGDDVTGRTVATFRVDDTRAVRHEIDPEIVAETVETQMARIEGDRTVSVARATKELADCEAAIEAGTWKGPKPVDPAIVEQTFERANAREKDYYAKVRIIEWKGTHAPEKPFRIVYGDEPDDATGCFTGAFATLDIAQAWFTRQGR
jgi:hypothetical protein